MFTLDKNIIIYSQGPWIRGSLRRQEQLQENDRSLRGVPKPSPCPFITFTAGVLLCQWLPVGLLGCSLNPKEEKGTSLAGPLGTNAKLSPQVHSERLQHLQTTPGVGILATVSFSYVVNEWLPPLEPVSAGFLPIPPCSAGCAGTPRQAALIGQGEFLPLLVGCMLAH